MRDALLLILAGVCAALHVGKLAPALGVLRADLGVGLVEAGFLLSTVQLAGLTLGLAVGAWVDAWGHARSLRVGLALLATASITGAFADDASTLLAWRALEGFGFLLVVLAAPTWMRSLVKPAQTESVLGLWGMYMPTGFALGLLVGPLWIDAWGWRGWWIACGVLSAGVALLVGAAVRPPVLPSASVNAAITPSRQAFAGQVSWWQRLHETLTHRGPWLAALTFAVYSSQWLAVVGFLPTIYAQAHVGAGVAGALTALVCLANAAGNMLGARLLRASHAAPRLVIAGFAGMALGAVVGFVEFDGAPVPLALRFGAILVFSLVGGLVPSSLFGLVVQLAPNERAIASTVGWMQQCSALGQFAGPPLVAWIATLAGGWQLTWVACVAASVVGALLALAIERHTRD